MTPVDDNEALQIGPDPDKLFVYHRQQLSAMLDGELSPDQAKFMLRRLQHDSDLAACWERWQVCGDVLRGQHNDLLPGDFAQRVAAAIAVDGAATAADVAPVHARRPRLARWGGGAAIAASVALLAVFAGRQLAEPGALPGAAVPAPLVADASAPASPAPAGTLPPVADAIADATPPAGAGSPALPDAAAAVAAAAVAAVEVPRRASERRTQPRRTAGSRVQVAQEAAAPQMAIAAADIPPVIALPGEAAPASDLFPMPQPAIARPWPRALLSSGSAFTVSDGRLAPRAPEFEPFFLPGERGVSPWLRPVPAEPANTGTPRP